MDAAKPGLTLTLETLAVHAVLKADLPVTDLGAVLRREVGAVRSLMGRYTVRGVSMDLERRDGGMVTRDMWELGSKLAAWQFREDPLKCGDTVMIEAGEIGLWGEVRVSPIGKTDFIFCEIGLSSVGWNMDIIFSNFPSTSNVVMQEQAAGGVLVISEWMRWRLPGTEGEDKSEEEGDVQEKEEGEETEEEGAKEEKGWIWSEERNSFQPDQSGGLVWRTSVPVWCEEEGLELVATWTYRAIRT